MSRYHSHPHWNSPNHFSDINEMLPDENKCQALKVLHGVNNNNMDGGQGDESDDGAGSKGNHSMLTSLFLTALCEMKSYTSKPIYQS